MFCVKSCRVTIEGEDALRVWVESHEDVTDNTGGIHSPVWFGGSETAYEYAYQLIMHERNRLLSRIDDLDKMIEDARKSCRPEREPDPQVEVKWEA